MVVSPELHSVRVFDPHPQHPFHGTMITLAPLPRAKSVPFSNTPPKFATVMKNDASIDAYEDNTRGELR